MAKDQPSQVPCKTRLGVYSRPVLVKLVLFLSILPGFAGCGSSSDKEGGSGADAATAVDAGNEVDAAVAPDGGDTTPMTLLVERDSIPQAGLDVVVHDSAGQPVLVLQTDGSGSVVTQVAPESIVTVVGFDTFSIYDVQPGDNLHIDIGYGGSSDTPTVRDVVLPEGPMGTTFFRMESGCDTDAGADWNGPFELEVDSGCLNAAGTFNAIAFAQEPASTITHMSSLKGIVNDSEKLLFPAWHQDFFDFTFTVSNGSFGSLGSFEAAQLVDNITYRAPHKSGNTQSNIFQVAPSFAELIQYRGHVRQGQPTGNGSYPSKGFFGKRIPATLMADDIDIVNDLLPAVTGATVANTAQGKATFSWTTAATGDEADGVLVRSRWFANNAMYTWAFSVPSDWRDVTTPTLPPGLSTFAASSVFDSPYVVLVETSDFATPNEFREGGMNLINGLKFLKEGEAFVRGSSYFPSPF